MKTNQDGGDSEPFGVLYSANTTTDRVDERPELDRVGDTRLFKVGNSVSDTVAPTVASREPFPLRTLIVCFTIWLIATQAMVFDEIKFKTRADLLEQTIQALGESHLVVPNERPPNPPTGAKMQTL
jgi:hypothetical protein